VAAVAAAAFSGARAGEVTIWPAPNGDIVSSQYQVVVDGRTVPVYAARSVHGGDYAFAMFDFRGTVQVTVSGNVRLPRAIIRPQSAGIQPRVQADTITFSLDQPRKFSIEPEGTRSPLLLFAGEPETLQPQPGDPNVVYFGPGIHRPERIVLQAGQRRADPRARHSRRHGVALAQRPGAPDG
jgi:hypothetical protein